MLARISAKIARLRPGGTNALVWLVPPLLLLLLALSAGMASAGLPAKPPTTNRDATGLTGQTAARQDASRPHVAAMPAGRAQ